MGKPTPLLVLIKRGGEAMKERPTEEDPIYKMAEEAQRELQKQADEAQEKMERAGVWTPES